MDLEVRTKQQDHGFVLVDFVISGLVLLILGAALAGLWVEIQKVAVAQVDRARAQNHSSVAMRIIEGYIQSAGNSPVGPPIEGLVIMSAQEVRVRADLTGSASPGQPNKGDPDGDTDDAGEDITIRYNRNAQRIDLISGDGAPTSIADQIVDYSMVFFDALGNPTERGSETAVVRVQISSAGSVYNPHVTTPFARKLICDIPIAKAGTTAASRQGP